ncbi:MAG TPA: xanthine dehydrogenase family protein molybdopterin-binding subunit [Lamprocystis sp. (in: g-proteobacteria)]|nr:xanthine dehydrogenase family protein molybdopterin-binding subunit [Lamprocystis sp. (in: g-proteobacteria)]
MNTVTVSTGAIENLGITASRRTFLKTGIAAGAGLLLGLRLGPDAGAGMLEAGPKVAAPAVAAFEPNAFVRIGTDDTVTVIVKHLEMGQGTYTGLPTLVAEELDAAWSQIRAEGAPADAARYNNLFWGKAQGTGGSTAIANSFEQLRTAGAAARQMLVAAAAAQWGVPTAEIKVKDGVVSHPAGHRARFGELAEAAARQTVPSQIKLKDPAQFRLIGKPGLHRTDGPAKVDGSALFTQDVTLPHLRTALVLHPPRFGAKVKHAQETEARAIAGVERVAIIPSGIAVIARDFWTARRARDALRVEWDESAAMGEGTPEILASYRALAKTPGTLARQVGDVDAALAAASQVIEAEYTVPYLAHAAMEPMNCVIEPTDQGVRVWNGEQSQTGDQAAVAQVLGLKPEQVEIRMLFAGGSFGRRANPASDYLVEAAHCYQALEARLPVKLLWTREDDMRAGWYRPLFLHRIRAGIDAKGRPVAWDQRIVGQSIAAGTPFEPMLVKGGVDQTSVEGAAAYEVPHLRVDLHSPRLPVPVQWWRSVGSTHTAFAGECMIDELAAAAGQDPVAYRLRQLKGQPRHQAVLKLAAEKAGWDKALPKGRGRGVAVHESFGTCVAQVAEVTVRKGGQFRVDRVVIAVDCGIAVNPDVVRAQMEGGMGFGLSAALTGEIRIEKGAVVQSNFHDYPILRIDRMPAVEVYIVPSAQPPTGVGEPATPVIAPAVANALFAATGQRLRSLPLRLSV